MNYLVYWLHGLFFYEESASVLKTPLCNIRSCNGLSDSISVSMNFVIFSLVVTWINKSYDHRYYLVFPATCTFDAIQNISSSIDAL